MEALADTKPKLRVLIHPAENKYAAECLGVNVFAFEPTPEETVKSIDSLIAGHILSGLEYGSPLTQLLNQPILTDKS